MYFPKLLHERRRLLVQAHLRQKVRFNPTWTLHETLGILISHDMHIPHVLLRYEENDDDYLYTLCTKPRIDYIVGWIGKNILAKLKIDNWLTTGIKIRVASSMMEKLYLEEIITQDEYIYYIDNLNRNVTELVRLLNSEELPF